MHVWRWWSSAVILSLGLIARQTAAQSGPLGPAAPGPAATAPAAPPVIVLAPLPRPTPPAWYPPAGPASERAIRAFIDGEAAALKAADPVNAALIKDNVVSGITITSKTPVGPVPITFLTPYTDEVAKAFGPLALNPKLPIHVQLNAIITIAKMNSIFCDAPLREALSSSDPAIRYWGAKGLGYIINDLKFVPIAFKAAITALTKDLAAEKTALVQQEILRTLAKSGAVTAAPDIVDFLARQAIAFKASPPPPPMTPPSPPPSPPSRTCSVPAP